MGSHFEAYGQKDTLKNPSPLSALDSLGRLSHNRNRYGRVVFRRQRMGGGRAKGVSFGSGFH
jgi:hypothetical protein